MGPIILGHAHPAVNEAVKKQLDRGTMHARNHESEIELCEKMVEHIPCAEMVRLLTSGSQATAAAVTIARLYTGKEKILEFLGHYHGWVGFHAPGSHSMPTHAPAWGRQLETTWTWPPRGIPLSEMSNTIAIPWNDLELAEKVLKNQGHEIAAAITEPLLFNGPVAIEPEKGYLEGLRRLTQEHGVVLIFDEVITGFRVGPHGAQGLFGVTPDITTMGKIIGGGLPVGAYGARREIMERVAPLGDMYQAGTLSGNPLAVSAGVATLTELRVPGVYDRIDRLAQRLTDGLSEAFQRVEIPSTINRVGSMFTGFMNPGPVDSLERVEVSDAALYGRYFHALLERGVYIAPSQFEAGFVSTAHTEEDIDETVSRAEAALRELG
jgi:glutamate-1-semialdehyde 2,1-aminomutase